MEAAYKVERSILKIMSWNCGRFGEQNPTKLLNFIKVVAQNKPDIVCIQEAANYVTRLPGYNVYKASGSFSPNQHGAVTYVKADLGPVVQAQEKLADDVHLKLVDLDLDIYNVYVPWDQEYRDLAKRHHADWVLSLFRTRALIAGDFNWLIPHLQDY